MYFSLIVLVIFLILISVILTNYKNKAINAGEADLSLIDKNILFFCSTCKYISFISLLLIIVSGVILVLAPGSNANGEWKLFNLNLKNWTFFHDIVVTVFILSFAFHTYIHWGWVKAIIAGRLRSAGKMF